jgi:hypothetical protein
MSQQGLDAASRARLRREWQAAVAIVVGGFVIAAAVAAYFTWAPPGFLSGEPAQVARHRTPEERERADRMATVALCTSALNTAKSFGIIPNYTKLASTGLQTTDVQGRYVCLVTTGVAKYMVAADLLCRDLRNKRCVNVFSVTRDDGTVLYQRQS